MSSEAVIGETRLPNLLHRGKVRDTYPLGRDHLLMIATDRISAFDVVIPSPVPEKGKALARLSEFWFRKSSEVVPNHFVAMAGTPEVPLHLQAHPLLNSMDPETEARAMIVRRASRIDVECVVRGYLAGSAWTEYSRHGTVHGAPMPTGLREGERLPEPIFTPTTKAEVGHDRPMTMEEVAALAGEEVAEELREASLRTYDFAHEYATARGILVADTKMEFGFVDGRLALIDELLTPDSSRFWDLAAYRPGEALPNFDKQFVRDWLTSTGWNREPPAPELPRDVVRRTTQRYLEVYSRLTGRPLERPSWRERLPV